MWSQILLRSYIYCCHHFSDNSIGCCKWTRSKYCNWIEILRRKLSGRQLLLDLTKPVVSFCSNTWSSRSSYPYYAPQCLGRTAATADAFWIHQTSNIHFTRTDIWLTPEHLIIFIYVWKSKNTVRTHWKFDQLKTAGVWIRLSSFYFDI
jgi:hypothetical protein